MPGIAKTSADIAETNEDLRFGFGSNWAAFASQISDAQIKSARDSLSEMLGTDDLRGRSFLDAGSGSGLSSLAAHQLGASPVYAFDFDPESVGTTDALMRRYAPGSDWKIERGDVLDRDWLSSLGQFDIVYSWGVLHHTGNMWHGFDNVADRVAPGGTLFVAIYNDEGRRSRWWRKIKKTYNRLPRALRSPFAVAVMAPIEALALVRATIRGRPHEYVRVWTRYHEERGMSRWHDILDWVGGYPFEVATPDEVLEAGRRLGMNLIRIKTVGCGWGCNQYVFKR